MTSSGVETMSLPARMQQWDESSWCLAALALTAGERDSADDARTRAARGVVAASGLLAADGRLLLPDGASSRQVAAQATQPLLLLAATMAGQEASWMALPDEALIAQGEASGQMAPAFQQLVLPRLTGLSERLGRPGASMLDVGTGIGAIATAMAGAFPQLRVTGIDVAPRVLALAHRRLADLDVQDRVTLREQSMAELAETDTYDLIWVPAPFVGQPALGQGLARAAAALKPGGWLMLGHGRLSDEAPLQQALTRFKTAVYGGTALDDDAAAAALTVQGLVEVTRIPAPPGAPAITVGRRQ